MDVLEAIYTRRSIRRFTGENVGEESIKAIIKAGFAAPSAHNRQPWHFIVLKDKEIIERIAKIHPYAKMLPQAGLGILVCGDKEKQNLEGFLIEDCSASIQNMLLAAHGIGLGAVWCGLHPVTKLTNAIREIFSLPDSIIPIGLVVVGHREDNNNQESDRYDEEKIHYDRW